MLEIGHRPQNPPIGSNDTKLTSNKLFIFPNIVSISADEVAQQSIPELFVRADPNKPYFKVVQMSTIFTKALLKCFYDKISNDKTNGKEAPGEDEEQPGRVLQWGAQRVHQRPSHLRQRCRH